ncbi:SDR family oxidoreductase [Pseudomonas sp. NPDC089752]|uniref:SDR family oxidoreductase n=1 Tax=Pseudomonas sp. NPDC089752 TaxID=3364472 RepID=UPI00380492C6
MANPVVLQGQVAIVTGAARGIGRGIAKKLHDEGCKVVIWDLCPTAFDPAEAGFEPDLLLPVDVSDDKSVLMAFKTTIEEIGAVDILVNNAGINGPVHELQDYSYSDFDKVIAVNLRGVFNCCKIVTPKLRERGYGRIVNVASIAGKEGSPGIAPYAASKAGVIGLSKSLARELATTGVTVNCIAPVITETDLLQQMTQDHIEAVRAKIPMNRFLTVQEIADTVAFIASPQCSFTTGFVFDLSGGRADY